MGLRDRDYMRDAGGEDRGRRYEDEAREAEYGSFQAKRQAQFRKLVLFALIATAAIVALAVLTSNK